MRFAAETFERLRIAGHIVGQELERDEAVQAGVLRLVNHTHAATTKFFDDSVVRNGLADARRGIRHLRT